MSVTCKGPLSRPAEDGVGNRALTALPTRAIILQRRELSTARSDGPRKVHIVRGLDKAHIVMYIVYNVYMLYTARGHMATDADAMVREVNVTEARRLISLLFDEIASPRQRPVGDCSSC